MRTSNLAEGILRILEGMKAMVEFRSVDVHTSDMERADIAIVTEDAVPEEVDAIAAMAAKWAELAPSQDGDEEQKEREGQEAGKQ